MPLISYTLHYNYTKKNLFFVLQKLKKIGEIFKVNTSEDNLEVAKMVSNAVRKLAIKLDILQRISEICGKREAS